MEERRIFSEQEAAEILQRAAKIQETSPGSNDYLAGVTYEELERIAQEAGIQPAALLKAVQQPTAVTRSKFLVEETERVLSKEISSDDFDQIIAMLRGRGRVDQLQAVGRSFMCNLTSSTASYHVEILSKNGRTRILVRSNPMMAYMVGLHVPFILSMVLGPILISKHQAILGLLLMFVLLTSGVSAFFALAKRGMAGSHVLAEEFASALSELAEEKPVKTGKSVHVLGENASESLQQM